MHDPAYCTLADLLALRIATEQELIELTDAQGLGVIDAEAVAAVAETAAIEIDPYLAGKTPVPLTAVPDPVKRLACVIAVYYLYPEPTETVQKRYDSALKTLRLIADGRVLIGAELPAAPADGGPQFDTIAPVWHRGEGGGL